MKPQEITRDPLDAVIPLDAGEAVSPASYGRRAAKLARLAALGLPVPPGVAISFGAVAALADGGTLPDLPLPVAPGDLLALRCSPEDRGWGGPGALFEEAVLALLVDRELALYVGGCFAAISAFASSIICATLGSSCGRDSICFKNARHSAIGANDDGGSIM